MARSFAGSMAVEQKRLADIEAGAMGKSIQWEPAGLYIQTVDGNTTAACMFVGKVVDAPPQEE